MKKTSIYAHADTEMKRVAIQKATNIDRGIEPELPLWKTENDEEVLKALFGLKH